jgi:hypothetical protein
MVLVWAVVGGGGGARTAGSPSNKSVRWLDPHLAPYLLDLSTNRPRRNNTAHSNSKQQQQNKHTMTAKLFTILLALLCGLLSLCSVLAGTSAEGSSNIYFCILSLDAIPLCIVILIDSLIPLPVEIISGLAYLAAKGKEEGVVTLPSGLLYKEIRPGNGEFFSSWVLSVGSAAAAAFADDHRLTINLASCTQITKPMAKRPPSIHPVNGKILLAWKNFHICCTCIMSFSSYRLN